jgi:flagellar biosynthetic protein FliR
MSLSAEVSWLVATLLVAVRLGLVMVMTPILSVLGMPLNVRLLLVLALSATLVAGLDPMSAGGMSAGRWDAGDLLLAVVNEAVLGSLLAFGVLAAFAAFQFAGRIMDIQMGFGVAGLIDPATRNRAPLLGTVLNMTALLTFFLVGGHRLLLRGLAFSLERIPPGAPLTSLPLRTVVEQFGGLFVYAALLAAPVMTVVLLLDIAMAMMARTLPQMNVFIVGLPLKIFVGLAVLAISLGFISPAFSDVFDALFAGWQKTIGH